MRGPSLQRPPDDALERACREVEATVTSVAKVVLHASALADRMDTAVGADGAPQRRERVRLLRNAAEAGRRTITRAGLTAVSGGADVHAGDLARLRSASGAAPHLLRTAAPTTPRRSGEPVRDL